MGGGALFYTHYSTPQRATKMPRSVITNTLIREMYQTLMDTDRGAATKNRWGKFLRELDDKTLVENEEITRLRNELLDAIVRANIAEAKYADAMAQLGAQTEESTNAHSTAGSQADSGTPGVGDPHGAGHAPDGPGTASGRPGSGKATGPGATGQGPTSASAVRSGGRR